MSAGSDRLDILSLRMTVSLTDKQFTDTIPPAWKYTVELNFYSMQNFICESK